MSLADDVALWLNLDKPIERPVPIVEETYVLITLKPGRRYSSSDKSLKRGKLVTKKVKMDISTARRRPIDSDEASNYTVIREMLNA